MKKLPEEQAIRGEAQLRFMLNFVESTLTALGSALAAAATSAEAPEVEKAFRGTVDVLDASYKKVIEFRRAASTSMNRRALDTARPRPRRGS